jgi:hypothetical protein
VPSSGMLRRVSRWKLTIVSKVNAVSIFALLTAYFLRAFCFAYSTALKMEEICASETYVTSASQKSVLRGQLQENLNSSMTQILYFQRVAIVLRRPTSNVIQHSSASHFKLYFLESRTIRDQYFLSESLVN